MNIKDFTWKVPVVEALEWNLYKKSLNQELVDNAEQCAEVEIENFAEIESTGRIQMLNGHFVVTFHENDWRLDLKPGDEVFWSDPDEHTCSRVLHIQSIVILGDICNIIEPDGSLVECLLEELS